MHQGEGVPPFLDRGKEGSELPLPEKGASYRELEESLFGKKE